MLRDVAAPERKGLGVTSRYLGRAMRIDEVYFFRFADDRIVACGLGQLDADAPTRR